jgi:hypothetical protein
MAVTEELLRQLFTQMSAAATGATRLAPGAAGPVRITPPPGGLSVVEMLVRTLNVEWAGKNVRFFSPIPLPEPIGAALRAPGEVVRQVVTLPIIREVLRRIAPGTAGGLGQLAATFQTPIDRPVFPSFRWRWQVRDAVDDLQAEGQGFFSVEGLTAPETSLVFRPPVRPIEDPDLTPETYTVQGGVQITFGTEETKWLDFPPIPFLVEPLRVPTMLGLFVNRNFQNFAADTQGAVLLLVPERSPLHSLGTVITQLAALGSALRALRTLLSLAPLGTATASLIEPLETATYKVFAAQNGISRLDDWTLIQRGFLEGDTEGDDEFSSLFLVGVEGTTVRLYNDIDFVEGQGVLQVRTGPEGYVLIRDLGSPNPTSEPPGNAVVVRPSPWNTFADTISSVRFV